MLEAYLFALWSCFIVMSIVCLSPVVYKDRFPVVQRGTKSYVVASSSKEL